jgi:hypothetical protein
VSLYLLPSNIFALRTSNVRLSAGYCLCLHIHKFWMGLKNKFLSAVYYFVIQCLMMRCHAF